MTMNQFQPGFLLGQTPESWCCVDCGTDTAPGCLPRVELEQAYVVAYIATGDVATATVQQTVDGKSEVYTVRESIWQRAGNVVGCLCVGCIEARLGRRLKPKDFVLGDPLNRMRASARLLSRRER